MKKAPRRLSGYNSLKIPLKTDLNETQEVSKEEIDQVDSLIHNQGISWKLNPKDRMVTERRKKSHTCSSMVQYMHNDSCRDIADSLLQRSSSKAEWVRKFYPGALGNSYQSSKYFLRKYEHQSDDMEFGSKPKDSDLTYNLYLYSQLVNGMGFSPDLVKKVLIYDKDIINDEVEKAIDLMIKTKYGWAHTFIPDINPRSIDEGMESFSDDAFEKCLICGDSREEHRKTIIKKEFFSQSPVLHSLPSIHDELEEDIKEEESEQSINRDEPHFTCNICYSDYPQSQQFSLRCGHQFCKPCLSNMLQVNITEGRIANINCAYYGCELLYTESDIRAIIQDQEVIEKYLKFKENYEVNLDASRQWCPEPNCDLWVQGSISDRKVTCDNGHTFCFVCQAPWHSGSCKDQLEHQLLDYISENKVAKCPKCKIRTEKNFGCNHMTCICGHQWCWICKREYTHDHYNNDNLFGCGGMQFTNSSNKCQLITRMLLKLHFILPFILLFRPYLTLLLFLTPGGRDREWFHICLLPSLWYCCCEDRCQCIRALLFSLYWLVCVFPISFALGVLYLVCLYPILFCITYAKAFRLAFRDCKCFQR
ncbi:unnamed protein product [Moneuplotes crassus]|uniref:RBR-type E3 ubiquitin transferase n=1 Tax=Euplotes crassus TaxID=5936 RepID=A0AAD1U5I9_EUPCR|nr:unnamed protein product [Moneuplotes crassus]